MNNKYQEFWSWFEKNNKQIANAAPEDNILVELDGKICELGDFAWELGSSEANFNALTISPGGDRSLLATTKNIISQAPNLKDWKFYDSKQIKEWNYKFIVNLNQKKINVDIQKWEYVLLAYGNSLFDIVVKPTPYLAVLDDDILGIAEMVLDSLIGEGNRLEKIENIYIEKYFNEDYANKATNILKLRNHLNEVS